MTPKKTPTKPPVRPLPPHRKFTRATPSERISKVFAVLRNRPAFSALPKRRAKALLARVCEDCPIERIPEAIGLIQSLCEYPKISPHLKKQLEHKIRILKQKAGIPVD